MNAFDVVDGFLFMILILPRILDFTGLVAGVGVLRSLLLFMGKIERLLPVPAILDNCYYIKGR